MTAIVIDFEVVFLVLLRFFPQEKAGARHFEEATTRKVTPGLDRGLEVIIDRNFGR